MPMLEFRYLGEDGHWFDDPDVDELARATTASSARDDPSSSRPRPLSPVTRSARLARMASGAAKSPAIEVEVGDRDVRITNPDRVYFPAPR